MIQQPQLLTPSHKVTCGKTLDLDWPELDELESDSRIGFCWKPNTV